MKSKQVIPVSLVSVFFAVSVFAQDDDSIQSDGSREMNAQGEQLIFIDPETGELMSQPTEQDNEIRAKSESSSVDVSQSGLASAPILMPDGSKKIDFNGQFNKPVKVSIGDDGAVEVGHDVDIND